MEHAQAQSAERPDILIIDDDQSSLLLTNSVLQPDYSVRFATSGERALRLIAKRTPDLLLLDLVMPEMDGIALLERLRAAEITRNIPVLIVTARTDAASETKTLRAGADDFINKPINPDVLKARVANQLEKQRLRQAFQDQVERLARSGAELRESKQRLEMALETTDLGLWDYDMAAGRMNWSERHAALLGLEDSRRGGQLRDLRPLIHPQDRRACLASLHHALLDRRPFDQIYRVLWPTGEQRWLHSLGKLLGEPRPGASRRLIGTTRDITALKTHQSQLERMAHYDALTGLPNRVLLSARMHQAIGQAKRHGLCLGIAYLDLDGFKAINDAFGHHVGDQLLVTLAQRMQGALREVDTLARLGGDEFAALLSELADADSCRMLCERLLAAAAEPVWVDGHELRVSASLGLACYRKDALNDAQADGDMLLRQADQAMYQAKQAGKNRYVLAPSVR